MSLRAVVEPLRARRNILAPYALALLATYAYFVGAPAWNESSRLALTRAIVEHGTVRIDAYHATTGDKSLRDGHFYCDKAPGSSWLAVPAYAIFYAARRLTGSELPDVRVHPLDPRDAVAGRAPAPEARQPGDLLLFNNAHRIALWLCTLASVGLLSLLGAAATWLLARRHADADDRTARRVALCVALATPALPYATALYGHGSCGALLVVALALVVLGGEGRGTAIGMGAAAGLAVTVEYPAAVPAALLWGFGAWRHGGRFAAWSLVGAAPFAVALAAYHTVAFGHPLATGYDYVWDDTFAEGMSERYGLGPPDPRVAFALLFGSYRGLFYVSPVLLLAAWGLVHDVLRGDGDTRRIATLALVVFGYYLLLNAGYWLWDGGAAIGPRHMVPALGFLGLGLPSAVRRVPLVFWVLAIVSGAQMLLATAATPEAPSWGNPLWEFSLGRLLDAGTGPGGGPSNLGRLLGLPGALSLLPLLAPWWWARQKRPATDSPARAPS